MLEAPAYLRCLATKEGPDAKRMRKEFAERRFPECTSPSQFLQPWWALMVVLN